MNEAAVRWATTAAEAAAVKSTREAEAAGAAAVELELKLVELH